MRFFKHFTDAHEGGSMMTLFDEMGHAGPNCYWILVELCAAKLDKKQDELITKEDCVFFLHERLLRDKFRLSSTKVECWLNLGSVLNLLNYKRDGNRIQIFMPKLLECLDRHYKRSPKEVLEVSSIRPLDKDKDKDSMSANDNKQTHSLSSLNEIKACIKDQCFKNWINLYSADFVERELMKSLNWLSANPKKNKKTARGWSMFFSAWLDRGWPQFQKSILSHPSKSGAVTGMSRTWT